MTKFRHLIWMVIAAVGLILSASQSEAQTRQPDVGDQPGLIADDAVQLDPQFRNPAVLYRTNEAPGTIIVATAERHLYLIQGNGRALRYGIGVGREGFTWQGLVNITQKKEWPDWTPPSEMIARQPYCRASWLAVPATRSGRGRCILAPPCTAFTAPTGPTRSAPRFRPAVSGWSIPTSPTFTSAFRLAPRSSSVSSQNCNRDSAASQPFSHFQ